MEQNKMAFTSVVSKFNFVFTSNHAEVVSLPVNRYWPMKTVSPFVTACKTI